MKRSVSYFIGKDEIPDYIKERMKNLYMEPWQRKEKANQWLQDIKKWHSKIKNYAKN